jgi:hypothetical protein
MRNHARMGTTRVRSVTWQTAARSRVGDQVNECEAGRILENFTYVQTSVARYRPKDRHLTNALDWNKCCAYN